MGAAAAGPCEELGACNGRNGPGATTLWNVFLLASSDERSASASGGPHSVIPGVRCVCGCRRLGVTGLGPVRRRTAGHDSAASCGTSCDKRHLYDDGCNALTALFQQARKSWL
jgi:hypothetical protein